MRINDKDYALQPISQRIAMVIQNGDYVTAGVWVVIVMIIAFLIILLMNLITNRSGRTLVKW